MVDGVQTSTVTNALLRLNRNATMLGLHWEDHPAQPIIREITLGTRLKDLLGATEVQMVLVVIITFISTKTLKISEHQFLQIRDMDTFALHASTPSYQMVDGVQTSTNALLRLNKNATMLGLHWEDHPAQPITREITLVTRLKDLLGATEVQMVLVVIITFISTKTLKISEHQFLQIRDMDTFALHASLKHLWVCKKRWTKMFD